MGFEVKLSFHPRKEDGNGYDMDVKKEEFVKVGKPFDDTSLERLAGVLMFQMARRDIFVIAEEIEITELVKSQVSFKECKDGKGIVLKNKKFSFNDAAQMVSEDIGVPDAPQQQHYSSQEIQLYSPSSQHPHEALVAQRQSAGIEDLYANPNKPVPVQRQNPTQKRPINQKKVIYKVYLEPNSPYRNQIKRLPAKLSYDKEYPVHEIIASPSGRLDAQLLAITDDTGKIVTLEEKYFTSVGAGLFADEGGYFSGRPKQSRLDKPKLAFEDELRIDTFDPKTSLDSAYGDIPLDGDEIPSEFLKMPDLRPNLK